MTSYKNDLFLRTLKEEKVERPPVWLMRQAGRILPQYRAVRQSLSGFKELVTTPDLVAEVTIQPVDELNVDAAIIFSDILVIPECMGLDYEMIEKKGPWFPETIKTEADVFALSSGMEAAERLEYVYEGLRQTKKALDNRVPLIGFSGSPFTLLCYMVEGSGSKTFSQAKKMMYQNPSLTHLLLDKITETIIIYLRNKVKNGADAIQLFDSWAGVLNTEMYRKFCIPYITRITKAIQEVAPVIVFSKGAWFSMEDIDDMSPDAIGVDWNTNPSFIRSIVGSNRVLQGNMDPCMLYADHDSIEQAVKDMSIAFGQRHIVNLGHGVYPDTPLDGVKCFVDSVKKISY